MLFYNNPAGIFGMILAIVFSTILIMKHVQGAEPQNANGSRGVGISANQCR